MAKQVAVVIGVGPGLGVAIANEFATNNYRVALVSRDLNKLQELQKQVNGESICVPADASKTEDLANAVAKIKSDFATDDIDVVIFNAASGT